MLEVRELDVRDHSPLEPTDQPGFQARDLRRRTIAGQNDLTTRFVQCVERVEELLLRRFLPLQKLHVINKEKIRLPITATKVLRSPFPNCSDHLIRELLGPDERDSNVWLSLHNRVCDSLHQMRLTKTCIAVEEERVIHAPWCLRDSMGGCSRELVRLTYDKVVERISLAQLCVNTALLLSLIWRYLRRKWRDEEIHLISRLSLLMNAKYD